MPIVRQTHGAMAASNNADQRPSHKVQAVWKGKCAILVLKLRDCLFDGCVLYCRKYILEGETAMELNDVYDKDRNRTGRVHRRGTPWRKGEYGLVVCVWVYDGSGRLLLTRRAPGKSFAGTWENSGGAAQAGESSRQAIARELFEETGIRARQDEFYLLETDRDRNCHYDFYCLHRDVPAEQVVLQPGETDGVQWVTFEQVHGLIESGQICRIIAKQFIKQEPLLKSYMNM